LSGARLLRYVAAKRIERENESEGRMSMEADPQIANGAAAMENAGTEAPIRTMLSRYSMEVLLVVFIVQGVHDGYSKTEWYWLAFLRAVLMLSWIHSILTIRTRRWIGTALLAIFATALAALLWIILEVAFIAIMIMVVGFEGSFWGTG
jgi:hypothetical protein